MFIGIFVISLVYLFVKHNARRFTTVKPYDWIFSQYGWCGVRMLINRFQRTFTECRRIFEQGALTHLCMHVGPQAAFPEVVSLRSFGFGHRFQRCSTALATYFVISEVLSDRSHSTNCDIILCVTVQWNFHPDKSIYFCTLGNFNYH